MDHNPNTAEFYNSLYSGTWRNNDFVQEFTYEEEARIVFYKQISRLSIFDFVGTILDVGCGMGGFLSQLPDNGTISKYGIDFSTVGIEAARKRMPGNFTLGDVHHLPYADGYFDRVVCTEALEHIDRPYAVLLEIIRVMKENAVLFITVPEESLDIQPHEWPGGLNLHINKFSRTGLSTFLIEHGLIVHAAEVVDREIWLIAHKPAAVSAVDTTGSAGKNQGSADRCGFLFVNTCYSNFLHHLYGDNAHLPNCSYRHQLLAIQQTLFGDSDFYSSALRELGYGADDTIINCDQLQTAWARENGFDGEGLAVAVEQIRRALPDLLYIQDMHSVPPEFLEAVRPFTKLIVGQIASPAGAWIPFDQYDIIVSSFPHFVALFRKYGITAYYQPLAFEPRVLHHLPSLPYENRPIGCSFVGGISAMHNRGYQLLEHLAVSTPIEFWGYGADALPPDSPIRPRHHGEAWGKEMFNLLASSRITVNRHIDVAENNANNMRLFEATGCGALLITDYKDNLQDLFEIGTEVVAYRSPEECAALITYYLDHPDEAAAIARAGQARTLREHTYARRMAQTGEIMERHLRYRRECGRYTHVDLSRSNYGHTPIGPEAVTPAMATAWQSGEIPAQQRALVQGQLLEMYHGTVMAPFEALVDVLRPITAPGAKILEIGCASGYYYEILEYLLNLRLDYTGIDYSEPLITMARDYYPPARFFVSDGANLFFADRSFQTVVSSCILLHVPNYRQHIFETARVAERHIVAARTPVCRQQPTQYFRKMAYGVETVELLFNEAEFIREFALNGFQLADSREYHGDNAVDQYQVTYLFKRG